MSAGRKRTSDDREQRYKADKQRPKYDREELIQQMVIDILNGMSRYRVMLKLDRDQYPDVESSKFCRSKKYELIAEAYEQCKIPLAEDRQKLRDLMVARLEDILEEARDQRDRANAIASIKEICKLFGVYEPEKKEVKAEVKEIIDIDFNFDEG